MAVAIRALCSVAMSKWVAVFFGPAGTALFGQFINLFGAYTVVANDGLARAMVKEGAHFYAVGDEGRLSETISSACILMFFIFGLQAVVLFGLAQSTPWLEPFYGAPIWWFIIPGFSALAATFFCSSLFLIRGQTNLQAMAVTSISVGALLGLIAATAFGASVLTCFVFLTLGQILVGTAWILWHSHHIRSIFIFFKWNSVIARKMAGFTMAVASSALLAKIADYGIVGWAIRIHGAEPVGIWVAMNRLADSVNIPVLAISNGILLPLLSANLHNIKALREIIRPVFRQGFALTFIGFGILFALYPWVMQMLFSADFVANSSWVSWQVLGDFFRSNAFLIAVLSLATGATRFFFWLEISSVALFVCLTLSLSGWMGMEGVFLAHAIRYGLYWLVLFARFRSVLV